MPDLVYLVLFITFIIKITSPILSAILFPIFSMKLIRRRLFPEYYGYSDVLGAPRVLPYRKPLKVNVLLTPQMHSQTLFLPPL
jgi:hypothetical protein